jgi:hypothetical protein
MSGLPPVAYRQTVSYKNGRNGLASNKPDRQAYLNVPYRTWAGYKKLQATAIPKNGVVMKYVYRGRKNSHVKRFQNYLRAFLWANGVSVNALNPAGATGYYGFETVRLVRAANKILGKSDPRWLAASVNKPTESFAKRIGLKPL